MLLAMPLRQVVRTSAHRLSSALKFSMHAFITRNLSFLFQLDVKLCVSGVAICSTRCHRAPSQEHLISSPGTSALLPRHAGPQELVALPVSTASFCSCQHEAPKSQAPSLDTLQTLEQKPELLSAVPGGV